MHFSRALVATLAACFALASPLVFGSANAEPWTNVPGLTCQEIVSPDNKFTEKTPAFEIWLRGYWNGMVALSGLDPRIETLGKSDFNQLSVLVLAYCTKKPKDTVGHATTDVFAMLIDLMPGGDGPIELIEPAQ